jgi:MFS transporter, MCT family, solute carrier family 16 (monocarboxylic acid transporters), member 10
MDAKAAIDLPSVADSPVAEPDSSLPDVKQSEHTRQAWLTVAGSVLVYFVSFGFMTSFGYFQTHYTQNDLSEWSPGLIALIGSMQLGLMNVIGPVAGALFDVYGSKVSSSCLLFKWILYTTSQALTVIL